MTLKPGAIRYQEKYWHIIHKILAYHTPDEIFERELDHIYQAA